ncbi:plasmid mobilization relaxosome protein MobC [Streptomyces ureilyticus]|uniref:MobC family plasmid mobilization relaxosome protein n=1 Tax=Streptomyces ureilyticus TaxID=1775131 RepID=A0ABX0DJN1_9ACTN|nr:plasmid mobilization relaxosome protein MobC [Streptomyces ureilyticus]NGO40614.1 MobC family plasmid mobilization relaxosome protein [Streptomyces ureilyticus]
MAEPSAADGRRRTSARYREREADGPRDNRLKVSYNDTELTIVREAAARNNQALAAWVGNVALDVAKEKVVPVSNNTRDVLAEFIRARNQLSRIGNNVNQIAKALNADGTVAGAQLAAALDAVLQSVRRMDEATRQVMRERRPRS